MVKNKNVEEQHLVTNGEYGEYSYEEGFVENIIYKTCIDDGIKVYDSRSHSPDREQSNPRSRIAGWIDDLSRKVEFIHIYSPKELEVREEYKKDLMRVCDPYVSIDDPILRYNIVEVRENMTNHNVEKINGSCFVKLKNGEELHGNWRRGKREGVGGISGARLEKMNISMITGTYVSGVLTGLGKIIMKNDAVHEGWFHQGFLHGPVKGTVQGASTFSGTVQLTGPICQLSWVGWYKAGLAVGTCWSSLPGDGWLVGKLDYNGKFTGNRIAFIYPDLSTALVGKFSDGILVSAVPGKIVSVSNVNGIMIPAIKITVNKQYRYWRSSRDEIMCPPHRKDVYEQQVVTVGKSSMPESGEGLFAKVNIPERTLIAYYNGIILETDDPDPYTGENATGYSIIMESWTPWNKELFSGELKLDLDSPHMDVPPKYQSSKDYSATLAHKLNHSFSPNCEWADAVHPCYGRIPAVRTIRNISQGEELFVHYMIDMEEAKQWYKDVWDAYSKEKK